MECSSNYSDYIELVKSKLKSLKYPMKNNLNNIDDLLKLFEQTTAALLNPIKKLKISYNMRINTFKGKYENILNGIKSNLASYDKNKNSKNINQTFLDETTQQSIEFGKEHNKFMLLLEECLHSITTLNRLFDTDEFQRLEELTQSLRSAKKKSKAPILNLNEEDDNLNEENLSYNTNTTGYQNGRRQAKLNGHSKEDNSITNIEEIIEIDDLKNEEDEVTDILASKSSKNKSKSNNANSQKLSKLTKNTNGNKKANNNYKNSIENNSASEQLKDKQEDSNTRKLTDEECLQKMKDIFPEDKGLTKTFITRKLKKRLMIYRKLDFNNEETYKNVENTIPKKTGPNSYVKVSMYIYDKEEYRLDSSLMYFMKDLFNTYFIVFKEKDQRMKIIIAGHILKDIVNFLKQVSNVEFKEKYSVVIMKIKVYTFYEELIYEFIDRENIVDKKINDSEIKEYINQFDYLTRLRKVYDEIKQIKIEK